jgi:hypothetical protein
MPAANEVFLEKVIPGVDFRSVFVGESPLLLVALLLMFIYLPAFLINLNGKLLPQAVIRPFVAIFSCEPNR